VVYKNRVPSVSITTPVNNPTFAVGSTVTIGALPYDPDWTSGKLEFFNGATKLGEQVIASTLAGTAYNFNLTNVVAGTYNITVKATDDMGEAGTSSIATFTVTGNTCTVQAWNIATAYNGATRVSKNGTVYEAKWWTQGNDPITNSGTWDVWKVIGACNARIGDIAPVIESAAYPNPFTLNGEVVLSNAATSTAGEINTTFETSNLVSGIYVVQIIAGNDVITYKVAK
jgi:chitinase